MHSCYIERTVRQPEKKLNALIPEALILPHEETANLSRSFWNM